MHYILLDSLNSIYFVEKGREEGRKEEGRRERKEGGNGRKEGKEGRREWKEGGEIKEKKKE